MKLSKEDLSSQISQCVVEVDNTAQALDELVELIVSKNCKDLDEYVSYVKSMLDDQTRPITNIELDDIVMTLPTLLYFTSTNQEIVGIREDVARIDELFAYGEALKQASGTVQEKQAFAKNVTQNESLTTIVYQRANRQIKARTDNALEVLQSCKKVLTRRLAELELSKSSPSKQQS